jgi:hypothetical protein
MARSLESSRVRQAPLAAFSLRRRFYVPLILSFPFSLSLTAAVMIAAAMGWLPGAPIAAGETEWTAALAMLPQTFVVCVCAGWLLFGLLVPLSGRWSDAAGNS